MAYPDRFKEKVVKQLKKEPAMKVAVEHKVGLSTVLRWKKKYQPEKKVIKK